MKKLFTLLVGGAKLTIPVIAFVAIAFLLYAPFVLTVWKAGGIRSRSATLEELKSEYAELQSKSAALQMQIGKLSERSRLELFATEKSSLQAPTAADILIIERDKKGVLHQKNDGVDSFLKRLMGGKR